MFERLKGEDEVADGPGFAAPDPFHLAFVREEPAAVFVRQRFAARDPRDEIALFGVGEVGAVGIVGFAMG